MKFITSVDFKDPQAPEKFTRSIVETGFGVVSNHPIAHSLIRELYQEWEAFFASPDKENYIFTQEEQAGYFPFKSENAKDSDKKDLKEFYHFYPWYNNPQSVMKVTPNYREQITNMASTLLDWIEQNTPDEVRKKFSCPLSSMITDSPETLFRAIHYPAFTGQEEAGAVRAAAHEDINLITLLPTATNPGLQVQDNDGQWHDVPCDPGNIVINAGDMLKEASGGYYPSTTHRVINPEGDKVSEPRYSMPLFLHPRREVRLSERYTAQEYLQQRLREIGLM